MELTALNITPSLDQGAWDRVGQDADRWNDLWRHSERVTADRIDYHYAPTLGVQVATREGEIDTVAMLHTNGTARAIPGCKIRAMEGRLDQNFPDETEEQPHSAHHQAVAADPNGSFPGVVNLADWIRDASCQTYVQVAGMVETVTMEQEFGFRAKSASGWWVKVSGERQAVLVPGDQVRAIQKVTHDDLEHFTLHRTAGNDVWVVE